MNANFQELKCKNLTEKVFYEAEVVDEYIADFFWKSFVN